MSPPVSSSRASILSFAASSACLAEDRRLLAEQVPYGHVVFHVFRLAANSLTFATSLKLGVPSVR